jgi:hypothetical protein
MTEAQREQQERREVLLQDLDVRRRQEREQQSRGSTFLDHARVDDVGGRFGAVNDVTIVGRDGPPRYPTLPSGPWSGEDPVGIEPSLGYRVDAMPEHDPPPETCAVGVSGGADAPSDPLDVEIAPPSSSVVKSDDPTV